MQLGNYIYSGMLIIALYPSQLIASFVTIK